MWNPTARDPFLALYCFYYNISMIDFHNSSQLFEFHLFADDANLFNEHQQSSATSRKH